MQWKKGSCFCIQVLTFLWVRKFKYFHSDERSETDISRRRRRKTSVTRHRVAVSPPKSCHSVVFSSLFYGLFIQRPGDRSPMGVWKVASILVSDRALQCWLLYHSNSLRPPASFLAQKASRPLSSCRRRSLPALSPWRRLIQWLSAAC